MLNSIELKRASKFYNIQYKMLPNNTISVVCNGESWLIKPVDNKYKLYHKNTRRNPSLKCRYHYQRDFRDFWYMFRYIKEHKKNYGKLKSLHKINRLFDKINNYLGKWYD